MSYRCITSSYLKLVEVLSLSYLESLFISSVSSGDCLVFHNGHKFTTLDKDQDLADANCAQVYYGGFWYTNCHVTNPNGIYAWGESTFGIGINWKSWKGYTYSLKAITMKIRPAPAPQ
ncbi:unnamed protein product [Oncorhynchus mykiss]|uniref:Fibrinogen C-terminal domain-containing protein n=1 Tax=Oncorhynchus mykiss TaxID=8022 RepID=A0A060Z9Q4_ONCMY|nr:unnamed protein product [Oncorhynchus mykiss]